MTSYLISMDNISPSRTVFEIFDFKVFRVWPWPLTPEDYLGSKILIPFESPYMTCYLTSMDNISLSRTVSRYSTSKFLGFGLDFWPLKVNWGQQNLYHSKAHIWHPIWLLWTTSLYLVPFSRYSISKFLGFDLDLWPLKVIRSQKFLYHSKAHIWLPIWLLWTTFLYLVPFSRYSTSNFLGFDLDLWPLKVIWGQKNILFESPYMTSYLTSMDNISLSCTVFEIFNLNVFRVWPWPLTPKGHLGSKNCIPFESPYMTFYLTSIDKISPSRTVFEIFDFKVFRVWPWLLTPKGHLGSKHFIQFESSYTTSYLTSIDTISLPRTVFEIFDFKVFRVWPWPLTPKSHLGSKKYIPFDSPYKTSYLTSMDNISLSRTVFEIFDFKVLGFDLDLWPLKVIWGQNILYHSKAHIWLPIWLLWTPSLYLVPFSRYTTSKFLGFDLDLWPLKVIWGQNILYHSKAHIWLPIWLLWTPSLYLVPFSR